jgi:hypothetical protein
MKIENKTLMKKLLVCVVVSLSAFVFVNCGGSASEQKDYSKEVDAGNFIGNTYNCQELGWSMTFPDTWTITKKSSLIAADKRSKVVYDGDSLNTSGIKRLLAFQKNFDNNFQSTMEKMGNTDYYQLIGGMRKMMYQNYFDQYISVDTSSSIVPIDGKKFDCFEIRLFDKQGKEYTKQHLYTRVVDGYYFSVVITSNNEKDHDKMTLAFKESNFAK